MVCISLQSNTENRTFNGCQINHASFDDRWSAGPTTYARPESCFQKQNPIVICFAVACVRVQNAIPTFGGQTPVEEEWKVATPPRKAAIPLGGMLVSEGILFLSHFDGITAF